MHQYDVFISHASEDKHEFVRSLAEALRALRIEVWYDEFELRVGSGLRASIDRGLAQSRFGIVVLSESFFGKAWPSWELDGLLQNHLARSKDVLLPVWHGVTREQVASYSPPLANIVAVDTQHGLEEVVTKLAEVIRPKTSALVLARDTCLAFGLEVPVVTDDWWLDVAAYTSNNPVEGTFQEASGWGRWGFPLPEKRDSPEERGSRLAWAAMTRHWQEAADSQRITQITHPEVVLHFIRSMPGLHESCLDFPHFLAAYTPQLTISGFGGPYEDSFESLYRFSLEKSQGKRGGEALTKDGGSPRCSELVALRDPEFGRYDAATLACNFVQGDLMGPDVKAYATIDYCAWMSSQASTWMPLSVRTMLIQGMADWAVWPSWTDRIELYELSDRDRESCDQFLEAGENEDRDMMAEAMAARLQTSARELGLPETGAVLAERMIAAGFIEMWLLDSAERLERRRKRRRERGRA